jgi:hypothetical protein
MLAELMAANAAFAVIKTSLQNGSEIASCGAKLGEYFGLKAELSKKASAKGSDSEEFWALESLREAEAELKTLLIYCGRPFAPAIGTALGGPLGGMAVSALAKQFGVADEVEAVTKAIMADPEAEAKIKQLEHDKFKAILADKDSARKREMAVVQSDSAPTINKIVTPALALGVTGLSFVLFAVLIFVEVKPEAKDILIYILGVLSAAVTQILSYYFGSSVGSKDKGDQLRGVIK